MSETKITVVIPAWNAGATLGAVLEALIKAGFATRDLIVVDDHSTDNTAEVARSFNVHALNNDMGKKGAAFARNLGAQQADAPLIMFVDADVVVHTDVRERLLNWAENHSDEAAIFGSYDANPPNQRRISRIRNLLHHHTHQVAAPFAATFWTGLGAVRKTAFRDVGGFDPDQAFMEDIAFGHALKRAGHEIRLDKDLQCSHLKNWSLLGFMRTDLLHRAIPWSRLIKSSAAPKTLNVGPRGMVSVASVFCSILSLGALSFSIPMAALLFLASLGVLSVANMGFLKRLHRLNGIFESTVGLAVLWLHFLMAGLGFLWVQIKG